MMPAARPVARPAAASAIAILASCGCTASPPVGTPAWSARLEVLASRSPDAAATVAARDLEPTSPGTVMWARPDDGDAFGVRTDPAEGAVTRRDPSGERELVPTADGAIALRWQRDSADGARTTFEPPLALAPGLLRAGESLTATATVRTDRSGVVEKEPGTAQRTVRIAAVDRVRTPLGEFDAVRVDAVLTMKVPFASLRRETSTWVRPGVGPVAVRSDERILVMGIVPRNKAETRVRLPDGGRR